MYALPRWSIAKLSLSKLTHIQAIEAIMDKYRFLIENKPENVLLTTIRSHFGLSPHFLKLLM